MKKSSIALLFALLSALFSGADVGFSEPGQICFEYDACGNRISRTVSAISEDGVDAEEDSWSAQVFPTETDGVLTVVTDGAPSGATMNYSLSHVTGGNTITGTISGQRAQVTVPDVRGIYILKLTKKQTSKVFKVIRK